MKPNFYYLKYEFYSENVYSTLLDQAREAHFTDVILVSDELRPFKVSKFVLSANSPVMKSILVNNPHSEPLIYLRGVQEQELQTLLQLMYYGEATFFTNRMEELLNVTKEFQLNGFQFPSMTKQITEFESKNKDVGDRKKMLTKEKRNSNSVVRVFEGSNIEGKFYSCNYCDYKSRKKQAM